MSKILIGEKAREKILCGAQTLCDVVKTTIGPKGRNVVLGEQTVITNDGVTIADAVKSDDVCENLGIEILRQASRLTNSQAGDGTTSVIVLGNEILTRANQKIMAGYSPVLLKEELISAGKSAVAAVHKIARKCESVEMLSAVTVNSCACAEEGKLVAGAVSITGADGVVIIEENTRGVTDCTFLGGLQCPLGLCSPYFAQEPAALQTTVNDARVLIYDGTVQSVNSLVPVLELTQKLGLKTVIIARGFTPEAAAALIVNRVRGGLDIVALECRENDFAAVFGDIAAVTDATIIGSESGLQLENAEECHLGTAQKIVCGMKTTKVLAGKSDNIKVRTLRRSEQIQSQIALCNDEYMTAKLRERFARLTKGVALLSVGRPTQIETHELRLRLDDALHAGQAAMRGGIVEGGGAAYIRAALEIKKEFATVGAEVLASSLYGILRQICLNAAVSPDVIIERVENCDCGYDALKCEYADMFESNIIDPADVVKSVITNAVSVAATLITTEAVVA